MGGEAVAVAQQQRLAAGKFLWLRVAVQWEPGLVRCRQEQVVELRWVPWQ